MSTATLQLVRSCGGWQLLDAGKPVFWFPERAKGLEIARIMADARSLYRGTPASVEAEGEDGELEVVATFGCPDLPPAEA